MNKYFVGCRLKFSIGKSRLMINKTSLFFYIGIKLFPVYIAKDDRDGVGKNLKKLGQL